jgi:hypothetical protein
MANKFLEELTTLEKKPRINPLTRLKPPKLSSKFKRNFSIFGILLLLAGLHQPPTRQPMKTDKIYGTWLTQTGLVS